MIDRSKRVLRETRVRKAASRVIEALEPRAYLTGVVLGPPINTTAASVGISPVFANLADFNGDGKADLFVANSTNSISVLLGDGTGAFSNTPATVPVAGTPLPLATGDFNGDGKMDIVAGTTGSPGDVSIMLGDGHGAFAAANNIPVLGSNHAIAVGAFVDGGPLDVVTVSNNASNSNNAALVIGDGNGGASSVVPFSLPFGSVSAVAAGDFNKDGHLDFVVVNQANNSISVFLGKGNGTFNTPLTYATGSSPTSIVVDDFNGDTKLDIVTANSTGGNVSFLAGKADGSFAAPVTSAVAGVGTGGGPLKVRDTEFNGDGKNDLLVLLSPGSTGDAEVLLGNGDGTFHTGALIATHGATRNAIAAGDLNHDALTDVVVTDSSQVTAEINITNQDVTLPTASVDASQALGSSLSATYSFTVTYADNTQVDASSLSDNNLVVTFPDGTTTQPAKLVSTNLGNASSLDATYSITFPANLTSANNGTYTVSLGTTPVKDANGNVLATISPNTFVLTVPTTAPTDTTPPTASVDATQTPGSPQGSIYNFTVTYADNIAVDAATLGNGNLIVTFPNNSTQHAVFVSSTATGSSVQATYQISFSSNLTSADIGSYPISITANSVKDTSGNAVAAGNIGALALTVTPGQPPLAPTGDFVPSSPLGKLPAAAVAGVTKQGGIRVKITNGSNKTITGTLTITLYTSNTLIVDNSATTLTFVTRKVKKLKPGKFFFVGFRPFKYPATAGIDHLVADVKLNGTADSYDGATAATVNVAAAFTDVKAVVATPNKTTVGANGKLPVTLIVQNLGNIPFAGTPTVDIFASVSGTLDGSQVQIASGLPVHLNFRPGQSRSLRLNFTPSVTPPAGAYHLILTINVTGDATLANNTVTSVAMVSF